MTNIMDKYGINNPEADDAGDFSPIPAGKYEFIIVGLEEKATKEGTGIGFNLTATVTQSEDQDFERRNVFNWFNVKHDNEKAQQIGRAHFRQLCRACGVDPDTIVNLDSLIGLCFEAIIIIKKSEEWGDQNSFKKYIAKEDLEDLGSSKGSKENGLVKSATKKDKMVSDVDTSETASEVPLDEDGIPEVWEDSDNDPR